MGRKYRIEDNQLEMMDAIEQACILYVRKNCGSLEKKENKDFLEILNQEMMNTICKDLPPTDLQNLKVVRREIKKLQQDFIIVPVDKTSHDLGIICKYAYHEYLNNHIENAFQKIQTSQEDIVKDIIMFNKKNKFKTTFVLPYLYATVKLHKNPVSMRPIVGTTYRNTIECPLNEEEEKKKNHHCMTHAQQTLSVMLKAIIAKNKTINEETIEQHRVSWFFIVESSEEVALRLKQRQKELSQLNPKTFDFKNMYTNLSHTKLKKELKQLINDTFLWVAGKKKTNIEEIILVRSGKGDRKRPFFFEEKKNIKDGEQFFTKEQLVDMIHFVLDFAYVQKQEWYRQTKGIPMGCTAAPDIANAFCLQIEKTFILDLIAQKKIEEAQKYRHLTRYIDDFLTFSGEPPPQSLYEMEYCQTCVDEPTVYLGILISIETYNDEDDEVKILRIGTQEKQLGSFKPIKYSAANSAQPLHITKGIVIGQLTRSTRINNNIEDLKFDIANIMKYMLLRGHQRKYLIQAASKFFTTTYRHFSDVGYKLYNFTKKSIHHYDQQQDDLLQRKNKVFTNIALRYLKKQKTDKELRALVLQEQKNTFPTFPVQYTENQTTIKTYKKEDLIEGKCPVCNKTKLGDGRKITKKNIGRHMLSAHGIHVFDAIK